MNLLAIETATEFCSVALWMNGKIIERGECAPRRQAELALPMIGELLAEAGIARTALDAIAVGRGPGAFTGVRLAVSLAQGLALGLDIPVIPVSSLAALAQAAPDNGAVTLAVIDARMGEIYCGVFEHVATGRVIAINEEMVGHANKVILKKNKQWNVIGSGWATYETALRERLETSPLWADGKQYPQAQAVATLAAPLLLSGQGVKPEFALPVYLRDNVALTLSEQGKRMAH